MHYVWAQVHLFLECVRGGMHPSAAPSTWGFCWLQVIPEPFTWQYLRNHCGNLGSGRVSPPPPSISSTPPCLSESQSGPSRFLPFSATLLPWEQLHCFLFPHPEHIGAWIWGVECMQSHLNRILLFGTLSTVAHQALLSMEFSRQEYWNGLPFPPAGNLPNPGIKPESLMSPALAGRSFTTNATWEALLFSFPPFPCLRNISILDLGDGEGTGFSAAFAFRIIFNMTLHLDIPFEFRKLEFSVFFLPSH